MSDQSPANPGEASERELFLLVRNIACLIDTMGKNLRMLRHGLSELDSRVASNVPGATEALENMFKLWEQKCGQVVHDNPAGSVAAGAPAGSAAGGTAASAAGARMNERNPCTVLREENEERRRLERESLSSSLAAAGAAAGGAADVSDAQRKKRARLDKQNAARREKRQREKRQHEKENQAEALRRCMAPGPVEENDAAAGGAAAGGAAGVGGISMTVYVMKESNNVQRLWYTHVQHNCNGDCSFRNLIEKSNKKLFEDLTGPSLHQVYCTVSGGKRQPFCISTPLSKAPKLDGTVVLNVVFWHEENDAAAGCYTPPSDDDLYI